MGVGSGFYFENVETGWTFVDSMYFAVVTITTVGFGDLTPTIKRTREMFPVTVIILTGLLIDSYLIAIVTNVLTWLTSEETRREGLESKTLGTLDPNKFEPPKK